jgi:transcriptional regulator with AAA-type ATPase domain
MTLFRGEDLVLAETISRLDYCNPFLPERITLERDVLGVDFSGYERVLHAEVGDPSSHEVVDANVESILRKLDHLVARARARLASGHSASERSLRLYEDVALFRLYHLFHLRLRRFIHDALHGGNATRPAFYDEFEAEARSLLRIDGLQLPHGEPLEHVFALFFQLNRAFVCVYQFLIGGSLAAASLRGAIWESIFTCDMRRYRRSLHDRLGDVPTLIVGPSGSGKELVARAVGLSRYVPFDPRTRAFASDFVAGFHPLNLAAMAPTLIESELFGHRRGAFTGAIADRIGWFEQCDARGAVFLDEIGDLDKAIQVKLLRVLQTREFQRLGDSKSRRFEGKLIAATHRDLARAIDDGSFRADLYYRICADVITTPSLAESIGADAAELHRLVRFVAGRIAGEEADAVARETMDWIEGRLGLDYPWPGNFRELEQCVRSVLVHREYRPPLRHEGESLGRAVDRLELEAEELLTRYVRTVHAATGGNVSETARRLGLDRRTVRSRLA